MARGGTSDERTGGIASVAPPVMPDVLPEMAGDTDRHAVNPSPGAVEPANCQETVAENASNGASNRFPDGDRTFDPPAFDKRPGLFEATRLPDPVPLVYLHRPDRDPSAGSGQGQGQGFWRVAVAVPWQGGVLDLSPARALLLARELAAYAALADEGNAT